MVAHPCAHHLKPLDDLGRRRNRTARAVLSICDVGSKVALNQRLHRAVPVRVACPKDFVKEMEVDAVPFQVVFNAGESKIDEGHMAVVHDQDVVRGKVAMGDCMSVKTPDFGTNRLHDGKHVENRPVAEDINQGAPVQSKKQSSLPQQALPS